MLFIGNAPYVTPVDAYQSDVRTVERTNPVLRVFNDLVHIDNSAYNNTKATNKLPNEPGLLIDIFG